jgi:Calcineurin-like phosphoesterase
MRRSVLLLLAAVLAAAPLRAADDGCDLKEAPRLVAIGDVHGAYKQFVAVLRLAQLVDDKEHWSGGRSYFVQTGDLLDRGSDTRQVLDLMLRLEGEAKKAGGRVVAVLGNHEAMNIIGDLRYVSREEYKDYADARSNDARETFYRSRAAEARKAAKEAKQVFDEASFRRKFEEDVPLGFVERIHELSAEGRYGQWLRQRPALVKIGGVAFLHGGLTPEVAALGCQAIDDSVRRELTDDIAKTRQEPQSTLAAGENGPLWFRGMAREDETLWAPSLERVLAGIGARAVVVGHTVTKDGHIQPRFGGRVVMIDVGMNPLYGSNLAALEIGPDGKMTALYDGRREELGLPKAAVLSEAGLPDR